MTSEAIILEKVKVRHGAGIATTNYARVTYKGIEIGFITDEGIYLKMKNPCCDFEIYERVTLSEDKPFIDKCKALQKFWGAIYDKYPLSVRGK